LHDLIKNVTHFIFISTKKEQCADNLYAVIII